VVFRIIPLSIDRKPRSSRPGWPGLPTSGDLWTCCGKLVFRDSGRTAKNRPLLSSLLPTRYLIAGSDQNKAQNSAKYPSENLWLLVRRPPRLDSAADDQNSLAEYSRHWTPLASLAVLPPHAQADQSDWLDEDHSLRRNLLRNGLSLTEIKGGGVGLGPFLFCCCLGATSNACAKAYDLSQEERGDLTMRAFFTIAIVVTMAAVGLGGCFWHHQQAVQTQPLK